MRSLLFLTFLSYIYCVASRNNVKSLTESLGQEVIEIGTPIKELPPGLEEEPSADSDEEKVSGNALQPATKKDTRKTTTIPGARKMGGPSDDEEARIEKELAEIYKDTSDYKADSAEIKETKQQSLEAEVVTEGGEKPIARQRLRSEFKFQPDGNKKKDIERFRTSVDDIQCDKQKLKLPPRGWWATTETDSTTLVAPKSPDEGAKKCAFAPISSIILIGLAASGAVYC